MSEYLLEFKKITKRFPGVVALNDVSLNVKHGEVLAICGENGAGKSTLIKILSGVYPHGSYEGEIMLDGQSVKFHNVAQTKEFGIATIFQELELVDELTITENIFLGSPCRMGIVDWNKRYSLTKQLLEKLGINISPDEKVKNLTTGKQQLIEICKALSYQAKLLVLDEPTSSLADKDVEILFNVIRNLKKEGISCIYISHRLDEVFEISDRITVIRDGQFVGTRDTDKTDKNELIYMMAGREIKDLFPKERFEKGPVSFEAKNLTVFDPYDKAKKIIDDISFKAYKGEVLGIAGLVGAGRTELATHIFGMLKKSSSSGEIFVDGTPAKIKNARDAIENGIAYLTEDRKTFGSILGMNIMHNISLASLKKISKYGILNSNQELLAACKYRDELKIKMSSPEMAQKNLSGGNQQKVILGKWLMSSPKILILDEPTRGIDVGARYEIYKIVNDLVRQNVTVIIISSDMPEILGMCDRVLVMCSGKLTADMEISECTQEKILQCAIGY